MCHNAIFSPEEAWTVISKVKNDYNRSKLIELWQMCQDFVPKYNHCHVSQLLTKDFAVDFLPILKKMQNQSAGKKLLLSYTGNPYLGITRSIMFYYWMPTKVGSKAAMKVLDVYVEELEKQISVTNIDVAVQTSVELVTNFKSSTSLPAPTIDLVQDSGLVTSVTNMTMDENELNVTNGIGIQTDGFSESDGEIEEAIAGCAHEVNFENSLMKLDISDIAPEAEFRPNLNSTAPMTPSLLTEAKSIKAPRKSRLTKGSRSLKDSGLNLSVSGAWETARNALRATKSASVIDKNDIMDVTLDHDFVSIDNDDVFVTDPHDQSWEQIPSDQEMPDLEGSD